MTQMIDMPKMMMMTQNIKIKKIKMKTQQQLHSRQTAGINSNSKQQKPPIKPPTMALMFTGVLEGGGLQDIRSSETVLKQVSHALL